jgi:hypothetical protein
MSMIMAVTPLGIELGLFGSRRYKIKSYYGNLHNYILLMVTFALFCRDIKWDHMRKHTSFGQKPS